MRQNTTISKQQLLKMEIHKTVDLSAQERIMNERASGVEVNGQIQREVYVEEWRKAEEMVSGMRKIYGRPMHSNRVALKRVPEEEQDIARFVKDMRLAGHSIRYIEETTNLELDKLWEYIRS